MERNEAKCIEGFSEYDFSDFWREQNLQLIRVNLMIQWFNDVFLDPHILLTH